MPKYTVVSMYTEVYEEEIEAENFDAAVDWWESYGKGDELFIIREEDGTETVF